MTQRAQIIDITKSYLPGDPNAFVQNLINTEREDGEEKAFPVLPYEGVNFLPTSYGYKSYFGTNSVLDIDPLTSRTQAVFSYQLPNYQTRLIALCEDGIWVCNANVASSAWTHSVVFDLVTPPIYDPAVYEEWTWCVIENVLYMYQQGRASAWKTAIVTNELAIQTHTPTFLTMSGQMGIFKAGTRLGFWDSANSISWSSNLDLTDFTPSIENMAGNTIFGAIVGRIVTIKAQGEGFVVYSTKSIVGATFSQTGNLLWDAKKVLDDSGIAYSRAVTAGKTDNEHYVFSISGIHSIGKYNSLAGKYETETILPELYDYLKESRDPVYLSILQDRQLCFSVINSDYIYGRQSFYIGVADPLETVIDWYVPSEDHATGDYTLLPAQLWEIIKEEMSIRRRRENGIWIPVYSSKLTRMDTAYYAWWYSFIEGSTVGLLDYRDYDTSLASFPDIDTSFISTNLAPPITSSKYGTQLTYTNIRAFQGQFMGGPNNIRTDVYNERLIWAQKDEWDYFKTHQLANKTRILSLSQLEASVSNPHTIYTSGNGWTAESVDEYGRPTVATKVVGTMPTGEGNQEWLTTKGPTADAAKEIILRKTFTKGFRITKRVSIVYTGVPGTAQLTSLTNTGDIVGATHLYNAWAVDGAKSRYGLMAAVSIIGYGDTAFAAVTDLASKLAAIYSPTASDISYMDAHGNNPFLYVQRDLKDPIVVADGGGYIIKFSNYTDKWYYHDLNTFEGTTVNGTTDITTYTTYTAGGAVTGDVTTTYTIEEIDQNMGYSELYMLVTHWDLVQPGLYGAWTHLSRIAAGAMTPKVWDNNYTVDGGLGRDRIEHYSVYKAVEMADLQNGTQGDIIAFDSDPNGTAYDPITGYELEGITTNIPDFVLPGTSFLLQTGSIEAVYPTFVGAIVYDLYLKKWGKYKGDHKHLVETTPVNTAPFGSIGYTDLGVDAGIFDASGNIYTFDTTPTESWMRWGKIGQYRLGMTDILEVKTSHRTPMNSTIQVDSSMDGKVIDMSLSLYFHYWDEVICEALPDISARWHTVKISGNYDLTGLEIRSTMAGRR